MFSLVTWFIIDKTVSMLACCQIGNLTQLKVNDIHSNHSHTTSIN